MTDEEMLELAAKAAGYDYRPTNGVIVLDGIPCNWNPLNHAGDALELAVKLGLDILHSETGVEAISALPPYSSKDRMASLFSIEKVRGNRLAATCRVIVRTAAYMGWEMS